MVLSVIAIVVAVAVIVVLRVVIMSTILIMLAILMVLAMPLTVVRRIPVEIPVVPHEIDRTAASILSDTAVAPVLGLTEWQAQVNARDTNVPRCGHNYQRLGGK
jgi:hypothetical protein